MIIKLPRSPSSLSSGPIRPAERASEFRPRGAIINPKEGVQQVLDLRY